MVGDADGVIIIPAHLAQEVASEAFEMTQFEDFVVEQVQAGESIFGLYPATDPATQQNFAQWRQEHGR